MERMMNYPLLICIATLLCLWASARLGVFLRYRKKPEDESQGEDYGLVLSATLTLLGLLIGFSFSMAISRYDQRKNYEEEEANAIGTEYLRADLLSEPARQKVKAQLVEYLDLRIRRYEAHASEATRELILKTGELQDAMWKEVQQSAASRTDGVMATVVTGMNDVINRQGYTQAARWNRIPLPAWGLMAAISLFSNFLIGYGAKDSHKFMLLIVPLVIAVSFLLIADIDSPNGGLIRVAPQNMIALADSLKTT
jgi:amino acid transporter